MVVSEQGYGKRSEIEDYRKTNRGGKGVKTMNITEKTGKLVTIKSVTDENDLMIINKSGITIRLKVADVRIMGRATQGVDVYKRQMYKMISEPRSAFSTSSIVNSGLPSQVHFTACAPSLYDLVIISTFFATIKAE